MKHQRATGVCQCRQYGLGMKVSSTKRERAIKIKEEYARLEREGKNKTFIDAVKQNPVRFIVHLALAVLVIYLSARLVLDLAQ